MRLWVDDERIPPNDSWTWAKSSAEAIEVLKEEISKAHYWLEVVALDHDLGYSDELPTSYGFKEDNIWPVVYFMEEHAIDPALITVHTGNPYAHKELMQYCASHFEESAVVSVPVVGMYKRYDQLT